MPDAEKEDPNKLSVGQSSIRLEDLEPGALSPSRASAKANRAPVAVSDEATTAKESGGGASSREERQLRLFGPLIQSETKSIRKSLTA